MTTLKIIIIIEYNNNKANKIIKFFKKVVKVLVHINIQAKSLLMNNLVMRNNTFK